MKFNKRWLWLIIPLLVVLFTLNVGSISTVLLGIKGTITDGNLIKFSGTTGVGEDAGVAASNITRNKFDATTAPTVNNDVDEGYTVGSKWYDITADKGYACLDNTDGAAVWTETTGAGGGASTFVALTDTPANYTGEAGKYAKVNVGEDALEFATVTGEANTASNIGSEVEVFKQKTGVDLEFRTLKEGTAVDLTWTYGTVLKLSNDTGAGLSYIYGDRYTGQWWLAGSTYILGEIHVSLVRYGDGDTQTLYVFNADVDGKPTGAELGHIAVACTAITTDVGGEYVAFDLSASSITITNGNRYCFYSMSSEATSDHCSKARYHGASVIGNSARLATTDAGANWNVSDADAAFKIYTAPSYYDYVQVGVIAGDIKLDDLGATDDNTDLDASITAHGLMPKLPNVATQFFDGTGAWAILATGDIPDLSATYQPLDTALTNISGLTYVSPSLIKLTANDTYAVRTLSEVRTDLGLVIGTNVLAEQTIGIADDNLLEVDDADAANNDFAKFTANGLEGRSYSEIVSDLNITLAKLFPNIYNRDIRWILKTPYTTATNRYTIQTPNKLSADVNGIVYFIETQSDIDLSVEANWDTVAVDYRVAATRAGKDFYIYACVPGSGDAPTIKLSVNSTVPTGYTSSNSRKIGGFHCLCVAVGTIGGHTLTDFVAGDVLPASIWDLRHRAVCENEGMVFDEKSQIWVDIYLASGTGGSTASVNGGTISDTRDWMDFVDDGGAIGKRMLTDIEFQLIATGSNEETNITGSSDPGTTGGHVDTASRRMISDIGCEDCCGVLWQWLQTPSTRADFDIGADTGDVASAGYYDLPGDKGSFYTYGTSKYINTQLIAGGYWGNGTNSGSRARGAGDARGGAVSTVGCRFGAEPRKAE